MSRLSFRELGLKLSYISYGESKIIKSLLLPALLATKEYKRSVGYFSSSSLSLIKEGLHKLKMSNGSMRIIASPLLSKEDIEAISNSYELRDKIILEKTESNFDDALIALASEEQQLLASLILEGTIDIKIVLTKQYGIYHDKFGILEDFYGNKIAFVGSSNETYPGYEENYEKIRVFTNWNNEFDSNRVIEEENEFNNLWSGTNPFITTLSFTDALKKKALKVIESKPREKGYKPRDYQLEAINSWINNGYKGFFVMATGTGKTLTALFSLQKLLEAENVLTVIAVPYKHLVSQWYDDVITIFETQLIIKVSSEIANWESQIIQEIIAAKYNKENKQIIIITTLASFALERFQLALSGYKGNQILIVDEAHRFYNKMHSGISYERFKYRLGLSATPVFGKNIQKSKDLLKFFGGKVYELTIDQAIGKYLVNYIYHPIFVEMAEDEETRFNRYTRQMMYCFDKNGKLIDPDKFIELHRSRLRVISMAKSKNNALINLLHAGNLKDHFIVYCGDGKVYPTEFEELRHIDDIKLVLNEYGYRPSQFTARETMEERINLVRLFAQGEITSLVAIKCLDEGINIPSIQTAIILSSNDDYREFVQRRGRILRKDSGKINADIFDFVVMPFSDSQDIAKIELRRYYEYAKLAINFEEIKSKLIEKLEEYDLTISDIDFDEIIDEISGGEIDD